MAVRPLCVPEPGQVRLPHGKATYGGHVSGGITAVTVGVGAGVRRGADGCCGSGGSGFIGGYAHATGSGVSVVVVVSAGVAGTAFRCTTPAWLVLGAAVVVLLVLIRVTVVDGVT